MGVNIREKTQDVKKKISAPMLWQLSPKWHVPVENMAMGGENFPNWNSYKDHYGYAIWDNVQVIPGAKKVLSWYPNYKEAKQILWPEVLGWNFTLLKA